MSCTLPPTIRSLLATRRFSGLLHSMSVKSGEPACLYHKVLSIFWLQMVDDIFALNYNLPASFSGMFKQRTIRIESYGIVDAFEHTNIAARITHTVTVFVRKAVLFYQFIHQHVLIFICFKNLAR